MSKIFISYRRDDSAPIVGRIYDWLIRSFDPQQIFRDLDSIPLGVNFENELLERMSESTVCLVVIGPKWVNICDEQGQRRIDNPRDPVRIEVETALQRGIRVIPLLVMGAKMPKEDDLPDSLRVLAKQNGMPIREDPDFKTDMERLIQSLQQSLYEPQVGEVRLDEHRIPMVYVPAGKFLVGSTEKQVEETFQVALKEYKDSEKQWFMRELPQHQIVFSNGFWIDQVPVTNEAYTAFINDGSYHEQRWWTKAGWQWLRENMKTEPKDYDGFTRANQPRVGVTWYEATAYANWRTARLPTETEWEYAARGPQNLIYPWGNQWNPNNVVWYKTESADVGSIPMGKSWVSAYDLSGNVWEWCSSLFRPYPYNPSDGREDSDSMSERVLRGGSCLNRQSYLFRCSYRNHPASPSFAEKYVGFRCARSAF